MSVKVVNQDYHRNGIGGAGFVVSLVEWTDPEDVPTPHFVAISFYGGSDDTPEQRRETFREQTAVLQIDRLAGGHIEMHGSPSNSWRGADYVGPAVVNAWIARCRAEPMPYDPFDHDWKPEEDKA